MDPKLQHTPGPWKQSCESIDPDWHIVTTSRGAVIANVFAPQNANAHLIAAAPDLLEALKLVARYLPDRIIRCNGDKCRDPWCASCFREADAYAFMDKVEADRDFIRAAIAKARGQE